MSIFNSVNDLSNNFSDTLELFKSEYNDSDHINILSIVLTDFKDWEWKNYDDLNKFPSDEQFIDLFSQDMKMYSEVLKKYDIRRITYIVNVTGKIPLFFTFRQRTGYKEDSIYR
jgi:hypothetical protein